MILYCDTSALVKLYVKEPHSAELKKLVEEAEAVAVSRIAWAEAHAALSRRAREQPGDEAAVALAKKNLASDWGSYVIIEANQNVMVKAGDYAEAYALRGYDSVQLASAQEAMSRSGSEVVFACFDGRLNAAAKTLGMKAPFKIGA